MNADPEAFCKRFSSNLITGYQLLRGAGVAPRLAHRQDSALIFTALEDCRQLCAGWAGLSENDLWCRFTLGKIDSADKKKLREVLNTLRRINPTLLEAPGHLSEFAFDFSMSTISINQGYMEPNPGRPFQFIVIAESELAHSVDEVAKDMLRLIATAAPLKVLVYNHWGVEVEPRLTPVLTRCVPPEGYVHSLWRSDWLFIGVPTYTNWCDVNGETSHLRRRVHCLRKDAGTVALHEQNDWWEPPGPWLA